MMVPTRNWFLISIRVIENFLKNNVLEAEGDPTKLFSISFTLEHDKNAEICYHNIKKLTKNILKPFCAKERSSKAS